MSDFYAGFEGEPELRFEARAGASVVSSVRLWSGYFDDLVRRIAPERGEWTLLARLYHLEEGFYERSPWQLPASELPAVLGQWQAIDLTGADDATRAVHRSVLALLADAARFDRAVWVTLD